MTAAATDGVAEEEIVLLDPQGRAIGTAPKISSHHADTPYHLAFSCYLVNDAGQVLITRRARSKRVFPAVLTNSACGHPAPGESLRGAVRRRLGSELGLSAGELTVALPGFSYRAVAADGTVEYEQCPVVRARTPGGTPRPDPSEVDSAEWWSWDRVLGLVDDPESSPWFRLQMAELSALGGPLDWPAATPGLLPPAVTW